MKWSAVIAFVLAAGLGTRAEVTPLSQPLPEQNEITIACELAQAPRRQDIPVFDKSKDTEGVAGPYHYRLWLPRGYLADAQRSWPCMFIADPGGDANFGNMGNWLKSHGYIVVLLQESRNGPWQPIIGNFLAAHDDVVKRVRVLDGLKMATGMSGGARAASVFVQIRPGFCAVILQGAGAAYNDNNQYYASGIKKLNPFFVAMTMGESDDNRGEIGRMKGVLGSNHLKVLQFPGGHIWASTEIFDSAMDWVERQIYEDTPVTPALRAAYVQRLRTQLDQFASATAPWQRYKLANAALAYGRNRNLAMDPAVAPSMNQLQSELTRLRTDPGITREVLASDALNRIEQMRERTSPAMFVMNCRNVAKQYPGTEAAAKAEQLVKDAK